MRTHITGQRWDSTLEIRGVTAKLTLEMNIHFVAVDGTGSFPGRLNIRQWPFGENAEINGELRDNYGVYPLMRWNYPTEFFPLRQKLINGIERAWNDKYWLNPARGWYRNEAINLDEALPVECCVKINSVLVNAHFTAYCIKPLNSVGTGSGGTADQSATFRSYVAHGGVWGVFTIDDAQSQSHGTEPGMEITIPVDADKDGTVDYDINEPLSYRQVPIAHEFSHIIRLNHVNGRGNDDWRYGRNYSERRQITGRGMDILPIHMVPWRNRLIRHIEPRRINWEFSERPKRFFYTSRHNRSGPH